MRVGIHLIPGCREQRALSCMVIECFLRVCRATNTCHLELFTDAFSSVREDLLTAFRIDPTLMLPICVRWGSCWASLRGRRGRLNLWTMTPAWLSEESGYALRVPESDPAYCLLSPLPAQALLVVSVNNSVDGKERLSKGDIRFRNHCEPARACDDMEEEQQATPKRRASTSRLHHIATDRAADS